MRNSSIRKTLPRLTRMMLLILTLLILPVNIWLQLNLKHRSQEESSRQVFAQLEQVIEKNGEELEQKRREFSEKCIRSAQIAAYYVAADPAVCADLERTRQLARTLDVDELHFINPKGEIQAGTHPEYYGYSFYSGEQMGFFLPMLEDKGMKLCQDIMPNTAEGKKMQYAAVWLEDGSGIVQIGMEPVRLLKEMNEKSLVRVIASIPQDVRGYLHVYDKDSGRVIASTADGLIGKYWREGEEEEAGSFSGVLHYRYQGKRYCVYTQEYGNYTLIRTYLSRYPVQETAVSTVLVLLYIVFAAAIVIGVIVWYVNRRLSHNLERIVGELRKMKDGNLEMITLKTGITEFDELIFYINQLLKSIRLNWNKLSNVIDKGKLPVGIFENNLFYKKTFMNERLLEILGIEDYEDMSPESLAGLALERLELAEREKVDEEEQICAYPKNDTIVHLRIEKSSDEQSVTYYVTDVSLWWGEIHMLREQSSRDALTGLYNRRGFSERMDALFLEKEKLGYGMMIMLDADGLKKTNDIYGHHIGDDYLIGIGAALRDAAGGNAVCARLGGDEFAVFLYGYASRQQVKEVLYRIMGRRGEASREEAADRKGNIEFSLGYAFYPMDGQDYHMLMHMADENMYQEKKKRKLLTAGKRGGR